MIFAKAPELERHKYQPIGKCIYCGSTTCLSDEHIVPFGLGGNLILPKSSCEECATITSKFELSVLRGSMHPARVYLDIQSRKQHKTASDTYSIVMEKNNKIETIELPIDEYPILVPFPKFSVPGCLLQKEKSKGIQLQGISTLSFGMKPDDVIKKYGASRLIIEPTGDKPTDFARMIAKIAFSMAVATGAFESTDYSKSLVLPAILGKKDDIGHWVGTITDPVTSAKYHDHRILIHKDEEKGFLIGDVQIFSNSETPRYGVILSELK